MANELVHTSAGTVLTQAEFEAVGLHVCNNQATGDLIYASSASQLSRLAIGSTNDVMQVIGGVPTWVTSPTITSMLATSGLGVGSDVALSELTTSQLFSRFNKSSPTSNSFACYGVMVITETSANNSKLIHGTMGNVIVSADNTKDWTGAISGVTAEYETREPSAGSYTVATAHLFDGRGYIRASTTVTDGVGLYLGNPTVAGTLTNNYGIYLENMTSGGTLNYAIYSAGGLVYFAGATTLASGGILQGTFTAGTGLTLPAHALAGTLSAASYAITNVGYINGKSATEGMWIYALRNAANTGIGFAISTLTAADAQTNRFTLTSGVNVAVATWANVTHTGLTLSGALDVAGQYLTFLERAAPGAGAANEVRMYAVVDGGTLTDMACVFQDGTVDIFAQEVTPLDAPTFTYPSGTVTNLVLRKEHPGLVKLVSVFPNGKEFVLKEIEYHDPEKIAANKGTEHPLPTDWLIEDATQRATRLEAERIADLPKEEI